MTCDSASYRQCGLHRTRTQTVQARHVHIHSGAQGVVGIINSGKDGSGGRGRGGQDGGPALDNSSQSKS